MTDTLSLVSQVKSNCNISDAQYWGLFSPCGLLLRLRDLYKIEHNQQPWENVAHKKIADWIGEREQLWKKLECLDLQKIMIDGRDYNPFDATGINAVIFDKGLVYTAGYGIHLKPTFLLAYCEKKMKTGRYSIFFTGKEIARDLSTSPAMLRGNTITARQETMKFFLWGKFEESLSRPQSRALSQAFSEYGIAKTLTEHPAPGLLERGFLNMVREELTSYVHHELGEASQRILLGKWWKELLLKLPCGRVEFLIRAMKDILADTCDKGMLTHIIKERKAGSLGLYVALLTGFRKHMFPAVVKAYDEFLQVRDWQLIEAARRQGYKTVKTYVNQLKTLAEKGNVSAKNIEAHVLGKIIS